MAQGKENKNISIKFFQRALLGAAVFSFGLFTVQVSESFMPNEDAPLDAAALFEQGNTFFEFHDFNNAEISYKKALKQDPSTQWAHHQLGRIYFAGNQLAEAEKEFIQEVFLRPENSRSFYMLGLTHAFQGKFQEAEDDFRKFVADHSESEAGSNDLAQVLFVQGKFKEAENILLQTLARYPNSFLSQQGLGAVSIEVGDYEQAVGHLKKSLKIVSGINEEVFREYYPSLNPQYAESGIKTIKAGLEHNLNLAKNLQQKGFAGVDQGFERYAPYFQSTKEVGRGAVFLAASCEAGYEHTPGECACFPNPTPSNYAQSCQSCNQCGSCNTGTVQCDGTCSAAAPPTPPGYGNSCSVCNNDGACNFGTIQCDGTCLAPPPPDTPILLSPSNGSATGDSTPLFDWTDITNVTSPTYSIQIDNSGSGFPSPEINIVGLTVSNFTPSAALANGLYSWRVMATGGGGFSAWTSAWAVTIDTTPPTGSITASPSSVVPGETITVTMNGSDNTGVDRLFWNEELQTFSCGGTATCTKSWSYTILTPGNYTFSGRVYDTANNSTPVTSNTVTVTKPDTINPQVTFLSAPSPIQANSGTLVTFTVTDSGGSNLHRVQIARAPFDSASCATGNENGCAWTIERTELAPTGVDSWGPVSYFGSTLASGTWWYGIYVFDNTGNLGTASTPPNVGPKKVVVDGTPPKVVITAPPAGSWQSGNFPVTYEASDAGDGLGMFECKVFTNSDSIFGFPESSWVDRGAVPCTAFGATAAVTISVTSPINGSFWCTTQGTNACRVRIKAQDLAGYRSQDERWFSIDSGISEGGGPTPSKPQVTALSATSPIPSGDSTTISWTVIDSGGSHLKHVQVWRAPDSGGVPNSGAWVQVGPNYIAPAGLDNWSSSTTDPPPNGTWWYGIHVEDNATNQATESDPPAVGPRKVIVTVNSPPSPGTAGPGLTWTVSTSTDPVENPGNGICTRKTIVSFSYSDSDGNPQLAARVQVDESSQGNFVTPVEDKTLGAVTSLVLTHGNDTGISDARLPFSGSWVWRVQVQDSQGAWSNWVQDDTSFTTILHDLPTANFTFTPAKPSAKEPIQFSDVSQSFGGAAITSRAWQFLPNGNPGTSTAANPVVTFPTTGFKPVILNVTDSDALSCALDTQALSGGDPRQINLKSPLPKFFPVIPF